MTPDLVLAGGLVVDGTGAAPVAADVLVRDGRILDVVPHGTRVDAPRIELEGAVLTPGFVDIHTHSDLGRLSYPDAATRALQGVTTEVIGNCGLSPAPLGADRTEFRTVIGPIDTRPDLELSWNSTAEYLDRLDATPGATNVVPLVGHGSVRHSVMGLRGGAASPEERQAMERTLAGALDEGYWGLSLGFMYAPGEVSDRAELDALIAVLRDHDRALLTSHLRAYDRAGLVPAIREVLALAESGDVPLEISHLRSINDDGTAIAQAFEVLTETAVDVQADAYPYLAGHTTLLQLLPASVRGLGVSTILARARSESGWLAEQLWSVQQFAPASISIARAGEGSAPEVGMTLADLESATENWAAVCERLLLDHAGNVDVIVVGTRPEDAALVLAHPLVSVASDGSALALDHEANLPHPRSIGTFPRAFRELSDAGMALGEVIHKMTGKPAARMGLVDRGTIVAGAMADLVVLEPDAVADRATYARPLVPPAGIRDVFVAGEAIVRAGLPTGARPGRLLRRHS